MQCITMCVSARLQDTAAKLPIPLPPADLANALADAKNASLSKFDNTCVGGPNLTENEAYRSLLVSNVTSEADKTSAMNEQLLLITCHDILREADDALRLAADTAVATMDEFDELV